MKYIHTRRYLKQGDVVQVDCDTQCNFMLLTDENFAAYQLVRQFRYYGGTFKRFPARVAVPESGFWNLIVDLNGAECEPQYTITVIESTG